MFHGCVELNFPQGEGKKSTYQKESDQEGRDTSKRLCEGDGMNSDALKPVTYAFVDAANIIYRDNEANPWKIDLKKLIKYLRERFGVSKVLYFGGVDVQNGTQMRLYRKLESWGYELYLNPVKRFRNAQGQLYIKADVDSRMTFEMMRTMPEYQRAVVLTGDGDFFWVLQYVCNCKDSFLLASHRKTASELKRLFRHKCISLDDVRQHLEYFTY